MKRREGGLGEIAWIFHKLGWLTFGGPIAQVAMIHAELIEKRRWATSAWYSGQLGLMELVPGPKGTKMAIAVGAKRGGVAGGLAAGLSFIAPGFALVVLLSWIYLRYGARPGVSAFFSGVEPAAIAVIFLAVYKLARASVRTRLQLGIFLASLLLCRGGIPALAAILFGGWFALGARAFMGLGAAVPWALGSPIGGPVPPLPRWLDLILGHLKAGALVYGGGYVIVPFLAGDFVDRWGYLTRAEFLTGVAIANATPGPVALASAFIGFKVAGLLGAFVATAALFLPCFLIVLALGPRLEAWREKRSAQAFLTGVEAAAAGALLSSAADLLPGVLDTWTRLGLLGAALLLLPVMEPAAVVVLSGAVGLGQAALMRLSGG